MLTLFDDHGGRVPGPERAIPGVGIDFTYFFIMALVLSAWFTLKWNAVKALPSRGTMLEVILGSLAVATIDSYKLITHSRAP